MPRNEPLLVYGNVGVWPGARHGYDIGSAVNHITPDFIRNVQDGIEYAGKGNLEEAKKRVCELEKINFTLRYRGVANFGRKIIKTAEGNSSNAS